MTVFETIICSLNYNLNDKKIEAFDHGGALYVHTYGTIFGLAISVVLFCSSKMKNSFRNYIIIIKPVIFQIRHPFLVCFFYFVFSHHLTPL